VERPATPLPEVPVPARRAPVPVEEEPRGIEVRRLVIGVGAMLLLLLIWIFVHGRATKSKGAVQENAAPPVVAQGSDAAATQSAAAPASETSPAPVAASVPPGPEPSSLPPSPESTTSGDARGQWRVVAYTYNREAQAQQKATSVAAKHPELKPEVFTPNGHAPYLVTVGGTMSRDEAFALVKKAKSDGLPRDIYAQNYRGTGR